MIVFQLAASREGKLFEGIPAGVKVEAGEFFLIERVGLQDLAEHLVELGALEGRELFAGEGLDVLVVKNGLGHRTH